MRSRARALMLLAGLLPGAALAKDASGQAIYEQGEGVMPIVAGRPRPALAGRMTCAGCHGVDGRGGTEGGAARAPAITWQVLMQPTDARPAYDAGTLAAAIRTGISANGQALQMPQFDITDPQLAALLAHLQWLDLSEVQGLGPDRITLRLPDDPAQARAARAAMAAFNAQGGSYGRNAVPGEDAFADLGPLLQRLRPALTAAEQQLAQSRLSAAPGWRIVPRADSRAALVLRKGAARAMILPAPASLSWARASGADLEAARIHAITALILEEFRHAGRALTRTDFQNRATRIDLRPALFILDEPATR